MRARDGATLVTGEIHHVFIDPATKTKLPIPDDVRAALEPYVVAAGAEPARAAGSAMVHLRLVVPRRPDGPGARAAVRVAGGLLGRPYRPAPPTSPRAT